MRQRWQTYLPEAVAGNAPVASKQQAVRSQTRESDVDVPLRLAIYSGLLILFALATFAGAIGWLAWLRAWLVWAILIVLALVGVWAIMLWLWFRLLFENRAMLWQFEHVLGDLNGDGSIGKPEEITVRVEYRRETDDGEQWTLGRIPARSQEDLREFARRLLDGRASFSERDANQHGYSRAMWIRLRDAFLNAGWLTWKDELHPQQGLIPTESGQDVIEQLAE